MDVALLTDVRDLSCKHVQEYFPKECTDKMQRELVWFAPWRHHPNVQTTIIPMVHYNPYSDYNADSIFNSNLHLTVDITTLKTSIIIDF